WMLWQCKKDKEAAAMFVGDKCELWTNSNWDVRAKGYKDARNEGPSGTFDRGSSQQAWQNANYKTTLSQCKNPPQPFAIPSAGNAATATAAPPEPVLPPTSSIPGVLEAVQSWKVVWSWQGNNVDGPIAGENGTILFANNDAGDVIQFDPATGLAKVAYSNINTAVAVSRSRNGALFVAERGLTGGIGQTEPQRRLPATTVRSPISASSERCRAARVATDPRSISRDGCTWRRASRWMFLRPTASSSARFRVRRACTARSSAARTGRRSSASSSTARGGHP